MLGAGRGGRPISWFAVIRKTKGFTTLQVTDDPGWMCWPFESQSVAGDLQNRGHSRAQLLSAGVGFNLR